MNPAVADEGSIDYLDNDSKTLDEERCAVRSDRYDFLHKQFDDYRQKMNKALKAKDKHVAALQNRINLLVNENGKSEQNYSIHALIAQRDRLKLAISLLEQGFSQEERKWKEENANLKHDLETLRKQQETSADLAEMTARLRAQENYLLEFKSKLQIALEENSRLSANNDELNLQLQQTKVSLNEVAEELMKASKGNDIPACDRQLSPIFKQDEKESDVDRSDALLLENFRLKQELTDVKDYYEIADVESEEKISMLANRLEELEEIIEQKNRECILLNKNLAEATERHEKSEEKANNFEQNFFRQKDLIENLREELEKTTDSLKDSIKQNDDLLTKNASLSHELNFQRKKGRGERELILNQLNLAGDELQDCMHNLKCLEHEILSQQQKSQKFGYVTDSIRLHNKNIPSSRSWNSLNFHSSVANLTAKIDALERDMHTRKVIQAADEFNNMKNDLTAKNCSMSDHTDD